MSKGIIDTVAGAALIAGAVALEIVTAGAATPLAAAMISAGSGLLLTGIGTLLAQNGTQGRIEAVKNPVAPWRNQYGRDRVGGTPIYINSFGDSDKWLDMVFVLACHPCQSVDALLFDSQRVQIGAGNLSFTPVQQNVVISSIQRVGNQVTVTLSADIPLLEDGDKVIIQQVPGGGGGIGLTLNGTFPVQNVVHGSGSVTFIYLSGGPAAGPIINAGHCLTTWPNYQDKVYMEAMLGTQTLGQTFNGMTTGTWYSGSDHSLVTPASVGVQNPWTADCSCLGKTVVMLRLHYNDQVFANGLPQISFLIHGKNDIYDPRTSTYGYSENAALCIADYLSNTTWGFKAVYGTDIPSAPLIAAANICDEAVDLAYPVQSPPLTEPRYTCNGGFPLSMKRAEVLQNLLTSCAGRLTYTEGQFIIWPAAWYGVTGTVSGNSIYSMAAGPFRWRPKVTITQLFNAVKGTYIYPGNNWEPGDFPPYMQDQLHGYNSSPPGAGEDYDANLYADGGDRRYKDIQLPFTISSAAAQRLAKIELGRLRQQGTGTFLLNMAGYQFTPMDVIAMDLPYFGWTGKYLEVLAARLKFDKQSNGGEEVVLMGVEIDVQETDPSIYFWSVGEELSPQGYQQAVVPSTLTPAAPTDVLLTSDHGAINVSWDAPTDAYVLNGGHIEVEYQLVASPEGLWISLAKMDPTITTARIENLTAGAQYTVQIRSVNAAGVPSDWVVGTPVASSPPAPGPITVINVPPSGLTYTPVLDQYGSIGIENVAVGDLEDLSEIDFYMVYVDELTADVFVATNVSANNSTDPLTIAVTGNPNRTTPSATLDFEVDDWILWNDNGHYEIGQLTNITGTWPNLTFTIARHYPGEVGGDSTFEAPMTSHAANTQLFIGQVKRFILNSLAGGFNGAPPPSRFDMQLPAACVLAITAAPVGQFSGYGPWVNYNCATAALPGIRTCTGGEFSFQVPGNLTAAAGVNVGVSFQVPNTQPIRVMDAYVGTAPTGASIKVNVRRSSDGGSTWTTLEQEVILATVLVSWPLSPPAPPADQQQPYSLSWPFPVLNGGDLLNYSIEQVGSTIAGANLTLKIDT